MRRRGLLAAGLAAGLAGCSAADLLNATVSDEDVDETKNFRYAAGERHTLDVYRPRQIGGRLPLVVFIYGGGWDDGTKELYPFLARPLVQRGMVVVVPDYRIYPAVTYPAFLQDNAKAVAWAAAHAQQLGADPARIVLMGHSAGATHAASYAFDPALHPAEGPGLAGLILGSGFLKMTAEDTGPGNLAYFGTDAALYAARSPITHLGRSRLPMLLFNAEYDPAFLAAPTLELALGACWRDGRCPRVLTLRGHNHISEIMAIGTADDELGGEILRFVRALPPNR